MRARIDTMNDNNIRACWLELAAYLSITQISTEVFECRISPLLKNLKKIFSEVEMKKKNTNWEIKFQNPPHNVLKQCAMFFNQQHGN